MEERHSKTARKATEPPSGGTPSTRLLSKKAGLGELEETHLPSILLTGIPPLHGLRSLSKKAGPIELEKAYILSTLPAETTDSVRNRLMEESHLYLSRHESTATHSIELEMLGKDVVRKGSMIGDTSISSSYLAAIGLFTLQNLRYLTIRRVDLEDDFYKGMCAASPKSKIERFTHDSMAPLGPDASLNYARGLFSMPNLQSLTLKGLRLSDEFYSSMATEASKSKIKRFTHDNMYNMAPVGPDASLNYARGLFSMPNLQSLTLNGLKLSDAFYSCMATEASKSKIQTLDMKNVSMTQRILHTLLSLPCLQSLRLEGIDDVDKNDKEMLTSHSTSVEELFLNSEDVTTLWKLGFHSSCPQVQKLNLQWNYMYKENVSSEIITMACSPFHHLTHLNIQGFCRTIDPESFSIAVITSCPQLTNLSLTSIELGNEQATEIIQSVKTHPHLSSIELDWCRTDMGLDPLIDKVNSEGKLTVTVKHNPIQRKEMASVPEKKTSPSLQVSAAVSDDNKTRPIEMECHKPVGVEGNKLRLDSFGMELELPPGAIDSETPRDISFRVLTDTPNLGNSKEEMSVCFGVQCLAPDDLVLKLPVTYTIPHCAVITRYSSVETILYMGEGEYTPDSDVKERILLTKSGIPNCTVKKEVLELQMNHFSWAYIRFKIKNFFFRGKRMRCWPFAEKELPAGRTPVILRAHLYDDVKGNKEIISQEEYGGYAPVHPETEVLIKMAEVDVYMTCHIESREIVKPAIIRYDDICRGHHRIRSFNLDLTRELDVVVVTLQVGQKEQWPEELLCKFNFTSLSRSTSLPTHDQEQFGASSSQTSQTSHQTEEENPDSHKESKVGEAKPATGKNDFDDTLKIVAKRVRENDEIDDLGKALGFDPPAISGYIAENTRNQHVSFMGTLSMLRKWQQGKTENKECEDLKAALIKADQIRLANELFK